MTEGSHEDRDGPVEDQADVTSSAEGRTSSSEGHASEGHASSSEGRERARELLERIVDALGLDARVDVTVEDETLLINVEGDDLGLLIGRHGQTIDAAQHLAFLVASRDRPPWRRVVLDAAGYRARRAEALQRRADQAVAEALRSGHAVELEPMASAERRIVHEYLRDRHDIETYSEGDEPERRLVVTPVTA